MSTSWKEYGIMDVYVNLNRNLNRKKRKMKMTKNKKETRLPLQNHDGQLAKLLALQGHERQDWQFPILTVL